MEKLKSKTKKIFFTLVYSRDALEIQKPLASRLQFRATRTTRLPEVVAADDFEPVLRVSRTSYVLVAALSAGRVT